MKKIYLLMLGMVFLGMTLTGCKKEVTGCGDPTATNYNPKTTKHINSMCTYPVATKGDLVVNVRDGQGNSVIGYEVWLYKSQADFDNANYSKILTTNNSGQVTFTDLSPQKYWVDCQYNLVGGGTTTVEGSGTVTAGYITTITIKP